MRQLICIFARIYSSLSHSAPPACLLATLFVISVTKIWIQIAKMPARSPNYSAEAGCVVSAGFRAFNREIWHWKCWLHLRNVRNLANKSGLLGFPLLNFLPIYKVVSCFCLSCFYSILIWVSVSTHFLQLICFTWVYFHLPACCQFVWHIVAF